MARIAGVDIPREKHVEISLTYIYGIGRTLARRTLQTCRIDPRRKVSSLAEEEVNRLREMVERQLVVEGDLRRVVRQNMQRLMDIGCYRGQRHRRGLPMRGQRTRTNARTRRGPKKTVGARKKAGRK